MLSIQFLDDKPPNLFVICRMNLAEEDFFAGINQDRNHGNDKQTT